MESVVYEETPLANYLRGRFFSCLFLLFSLAPQYFRLPLAPVFLALCNGAKNLCKTEAKTKIRLLTMTQKRARATTLSGPRPVSESSSTTIQTATANMRTMTLPLFPTKLRHLQHHPVRDLRQPADHKFASSSVAKTLHTCRSTYHQTTSARH